MTRILQILIAGALGVILIGGCAGDSARLSLDSEGYGKTVLDNATIVAVNRDQTTSLSAVQILIGGGVLSETAENNGITNLMVNMLLKGNAEMSATEITDSLEFLGATVSVDCYREYGTISVVALSDYLDEALDIISQSLRTATFPEAELAKVKQETVGAIKASNDNQSAAASKLFWRTVYGDRDYGLPLLGTEESIAGLTAEDVKAHYASFVGGENIIVAVATDLAPGIVIETLDATIGQVKREAQRVEPPTLAYEEEKVGFESFDRNQSFIYSGWAFGPLPVSQVPNLIIVNEVMGANVGSRLWYLRQDEKLAYTVYSQYAVDRFAGIFRAAIGTDTSKVNRALESLDRELSGLAEQGITDAELADARVNMKNNLIYSIDRKSNRAFNMARYEYVGYGYKAVLDFIAAADQLTLEGVNGFVTATFEPDRRYTAVVGKM